MSYTVSLEFVAAQPIAAVRVRTPISGIASAWKPALDRVWDFLVAHPELRSEGQHNVFLYHHPTQRDAPMDIDFGVAVPHPFTGADGVACVETPAGQVATTVHVGPYERLAAAHNAIHAWCAANAKAIGDRSWEIYGDWNEEPAKLETRICYLLR